MDNASAKVQRFAGGRRPQAFHPTKTALTGLDVSKAAMTEADLKAMPCSNSQTGRFRSVRFSVSYWKPWPLWKCLESLYQHLNLCGAATASASLYHCQSHYFAVRRIAVPESLNLQARPKREEFDWRRSSANLLRVSDRRGGSLVRRECVHPCHLVASAWNLLRM